MTYSSFVNRAAARVWIPQASRSNLLPDRLIGTPRQGGNEDEQTSEQAIGAGGRVIIFITLVITLIFKLDTAVTTRTCAGVSARGGGGGGGASVGGRKWLHGGGEVLRRVVGMWALSEGGRRPIQVPFLTFIRLRA